LKLFLAHTWVLIEVASGPSAEYLLFVAADCFCRERKKRVLLFLVESFCNPIFIWEKEEGENAF